MRSEQPERWAREFHDETARDLEWAEDLVEQSLLAGAVEAEVYAKSSVTTGLSLDGGFTTLTGGSEKGIALRAFDGRGNFAHACTSWTDPERCREMVGAALAALKAATGIPREPAFPAPRGAGAFAEAKGLVDPRVVDWAPQEKREMVESALREAAWGRLEGTRAAYRDGISRVTLANSCGVQGTYTRTLCLVTLARAGGSGPTLYAERIAPGPDPEGVMETATWLARLQPGGDDEALDPPDLLLEPSAAAPLVRRLVRDLREEGTSEGFRRLASAAVTVVDDGLLPDGIGSAPFDGEGAPTGRLTLIKAGVQIEHLRRANQAEAGRPGCAVRLSYRDLPVPGGTNLFVAPGRRTFPEILAGLERGFLMGALESDARGDRSGGCGTRWRGIGWEVRDGAPVGPCRRVVFRADPEALLAGILEVSDRLRFSLRRGVAIGSPDLLIRPRR